MSLVADDFLICLQLGNNLRESREISASLGLSRAVMSCTASATAICRPLVFCILYVNVCAHLNFLFVLLKQVLINFCLFFSKNNVLLPAKCIFLCISTGKIPAFSSSA